ncbi:hypothetical protein DM860_011512 [Cuscuta australis]|uniref:Uncharacterized protein n=1 Tax=Cuscuta australis TaxID=267555 RepID=A0A328D0P7_9ASTE|nr:hypothetical protein DM860_011512 [Cuscuta australis]
MVVEDSMIGQNGNNDKGNHVEFPNNDNGDFTFFVKAEENEGVDAIKETSEVDITERANLDRIRYGMVEATCQETSEISSFSEESISCVEDSNLCDDATSSLEFSDVSDFIGLRKKVTPQWRGFIRPVMWRCKWTELQLVKFKSLAKKYDKKLAQCSARKQIEFMNLEPEAMNLRAIPFSFTPRRNVVFKRKPRRRCEETQNIAEYMSKHCLFSFNESRKLGADDDNNQFNSALVSSDEEEQPLKRLRRIDGNDPAEQLLRRIGDLQSRASRCRAWLEKTMSENGGKIRADGEKKITDSPPAAAEEGNGVTEQLRPPHPPSIAAQLLAAQLFPCSDDDVLDNGECIRELTVDSRVVGTRVNNEDVFMIYDHKIKERMRSFQEGEIILD